MNFSRDLNPANIKKTSKFHRLTPHNANLIMQKDVELIFSIKNSSLFSNHLP